MTARTSTSSKRTPYSPTLVDDRVLQAVYELHFLTVDQLTRLLYAKSSRNYVGEIAKRLTDAGYLQRSWLPRPGAQGRATALYLLARKGMTYLEGLGHEVAPRARPSEHAMHGAQFLLHTLAVNDVLIAARLLEQRAEGLALSGMRHERDLKRTAAVRFKPGEVDPGSSVYVVPDGWLDLRADRGTGRITQFPLWLEVDRGTEGTKKIKEKIRGIVAYYNGGHYERLFGTRHMQVVFLAEQAALGSAHQAAHRSQQLRRWCEEELTSIGQLVFGPVFRFGVLPPGDALDPVAFFTAPHCLVPFSPSPIPLLVLPQRDRHAEAPATERKAGVAFP
jgi:hypothetical protein